MSDDGEMKRQWMESPPTGRRVVRNFGIKRTHVMDVERAHKGLAFGSPYWVPDRTQTALCGVQIPDGVIMRNGIATCPVCKALVKAGH